MVKRQPSWFWVLRAWLTCRKSILSCCLPIGGADRGVCAWMRPAVRSRFWEMKSHYWLSGGLSNLQPLLSHYLCSVENFFLSIVYQESWITLQIDGFVGDWSTILTACGNLFSFFSAIFGSSFGLWRLHFLCPLLHLCTPLMHIVKLYSKLGSLPPGLPPKEQ